MFNNLFLHSVPFMRQCGYCTTGKYTNDMAHAHCMMDTQVYKHILTICNIYCFSLQHGSTNTSQCYVIRTLPDARARAHTHNVIKDQWQRYELGRHQSAAWVHQTIGSVHEYVTPSDRQTAMCTLHCCHGRVSTEPVLCDQNTRCFSAGLAHLKELCISVLLQKLVWPDQIFIEFRFLF
jgi:hypothetical protein